jgi:hypothetical protein
MNYIKNIKFMATYSDHSGPDHEIYDMFNYVEGECKWLQIIITQKMFMLLGVEE